MSNNNLGLHKNNFYQFNNLILKQGKNDLGLHPILNGKVIQIKNKTKQNKKTR